MTSHGVEVAHACFAREFIELDNPEVMASFGHAKSLKTGDIGIFHSEEAFVLVKVKEVESGPDYGDERFFVRFDYQVRKRTTGR